MSDIPTTILNVIDYAPSRYAISRLLQSEGWTVIEAENGEEALRRLDDRPDLVLLDVHLPDLHGFDVCRQIRDRTGTDWIPILLLSGIFVEDGHKVAGLESGADGYIVYPADLGLLTATVRAFLRARRAEQRTQETLAQLEQRVEERTTALREAVSALQREAVEHARTLEELRLRDSALWNAPYGIVIADARAKDLPIVYVNPAFERITGYTQEEARGRNCRFLQGEKTDPGVVAAIRAALSECRPVDGEILNYQKDGTPFWNAFSIAPVYHGSGHTTHFVGVQMDVTRRKQLEQELQHSQKMEAVGKLAGGVAHDFNNMLAVINGYVELLLQMAPPNSPLREPLCEIGRAGERAANLTRQLLAFSRKAMLEPRAFRLDEVVLAIETMLRRLIGEDMELVVLTHPETGWVHADPGQLEQVLLNLVVNARDAMPGGGRVAVEIRNVSLDGSSGWPELRPGDYVELCVRDNGTGMPESVRERVFEPFFTTKPPGSGTGLGLSMVFGIVKQSGGDVRIESALGAGTSVRVLLPRVSATLLEEKASSGGTTTRGSETVLVVEDEPQVRRLVEQVLSNGGYRVLTASGGDEALRLAREHGPLDLLVTDVVMPGMSGRAVAEALEAAQPGLRVLYTSGYTEDAVVRHGVREAEVSFLEKPFTPSQLARRVRELLDSR